MAKNFANIYADNNDSSALEQTIFIKEETTRGDFEAAVAADFLFTLSGGAVNFSQPFESSPHRSGRHHNSIIKKKTVTEWSLPTYFNIDTTVGAAGVTELDLAQRWLHKSMYGNEDTAAGLEYDTSTTPNITATILENGDRWARQGLGCFVESANHQFPGDGEAMTEWAGNGKIAYHVGVAHSSVDNSGGNDITLDAGEGDRFPVGAYVMLVTADGTTRSADTPDGSPRRVTGVATDVITVDGAALADTATDLYLVYYEPEGPFAGINDPQVGLVGSLSVTGFTALGCIRSFSINSVNNHELQDNCYGEEGLGGSLFIPGGRMTSEVSMEVNMNEDTLELINKTRRDPDSGVVVSLIVGDATTRHLEVDMPKVIFSLPGFDVPDTGAIPVTFSGNAYQSAFDAADEISVHYK